MAGVKEGSSGSSPELRKMRTEAGGRGGEFRVCKALQNPWGKRPNIL